MTQASGLLTATIMQPYHSQDHRHPPWAACVVQSQAGCTLATTSTSSDTASCHGRLWDISPGQSYPDTTPTEECSDEEVCEVASRAFETVPTVAVIGVGYVGEHLVRLFSTQYNVIGFDVSADRVKHLETSGGFNCRARFTCRTSDISEATHFLISVPTLLRADQTIDSSFLRAAITTVSDHARPGSTIVIESSVAVGMTRQLLGLLAKQRRFLVGMSPERVDPGRLEPPAHLIPKIVSGLDDEVPGSLASITRLYCRVFDRIIPVSRPEVAEMMKLYENCQRMIGISFANEMADACIPHGIDPYEVCRAAASKPFGYMPFEPSIGVGGHCIPINPYYLLSNSDFPLLHAAAEKMRSRPAVVAKRLLDRVCRNLHADCSALEPSSALRPRVLVVGIGFKRGQSHLANSPGLELAKSLVSTGKIDVAWADPLVRQDAVPDIQRLDDTTEWNRESLRQRFSCIIVAFRQLGLDFDVLAGLEKEGVAVEMWCS